jgi:hypothetical protein
MRKPKLVMLAAFAAALAVPTLAAAQRNGDRYDDRYDDRRERRHDGSDYADIVRCESIKKRIAYCEADTRDGVHLIEQFSDADCVEGRSWGYDRGRIWVDRGCAAEFGVGGASRYSDRGRDGDRRGDRDGRRRDEGRYAEPAVQPYQGPGREYVLCESKDNHRRQCAADLKGRSVAVYQNISRIPCEEGRNWGYDASGIWVDQGCRAQFGVTARGALQPR